jgi:hypothetical protein
MISSDAIVEVNSVSNSSDDGSDGGYSGVESSSDPIGSKCTTQDQERDILQERQFRERLVGTETRAIRFWKGAVVLFIVATSAGVITGTYRFLEAADRTAFVEAVRDSCSGPLLSPTAILTLAVLISNALSRRSLVRRSYQCNSPSD